MVDLERIESVKAGCGGAIAAGVAFVGLTLVKGGVLHEGLGTEQTVLSGAIAVISGALFGLTYRYGVRQDNNPHLRSGLVLAFGLVRGLAEVEGRLAGAKPSIWVLLWPIVWPLPEASITQLLLLGQVGVESVVLFAMAQVSLQWGLRRGLLQPFKGQ